MRPVCRLPGCWAHQNSSTPLPSETKIDKMGKCHDAHDSHDSHDSLMGAQNGIVSAHVWCDVWCSFPHIFPTRKARAVTSTSIALNRSKTSAVKIGWQKKKPWAASVVIKCPWNRRSIMNHYESNSIRMVKNVECTGGWPTSWTSFQDFHSANPPEVKSQTFSVKPWATRWSSNLFVQVSHPYVIPWGEEHQSTLAASSTQHNTTTKGVNMSYHPPISRHDNLWQPYMYVIIHIRSYPVTSKSDTWSPRMGSKPVILDDSAWQETCCGELCPNCRSLAQCWRQNNCHMKPYLLRQSLFQAWVEV